MYRLISAIFLHANFIHILFNSIALLSIMSYLEVSYGAIITGLIFLISGIGGNIFSACVSKYSPFLVSVGASTSIFGMVGCWIAFMILNWRGLKNIVGEENRCKFLCIVLMYVMFIWILSGVGQ